MAVTQRRFPYPFKAMFAMSSDCEGTGLKDHERLHRFVNTQTPQTEMPFYSYDGLGIDYSDSFFFHTIGYIHLSIFNPWYQFPSYEKYYLEDTTGILDKRAVSSNEDGRWILETPGADYIEKYILCGWLDFLHGGHADNGEVLERYGLRNWTRLDGQQYLDWIERRGLKGKIQVFINHSNVTANFGTSIEPLGYRNCGDDPDSPAYWADLALESGMKFFWSYNPSTSVAYRTTMGRESMLEPKTFRDGNKYWHFSRYSSGGSTKGNLIADGQITQNLLNYIEANGLFEISYSHFGNSSVKQDGIIVDPEISSASQGALKLLSDYHNAGRVCATRISRLLKYDLALHYLIFTATEDAITSINITSINDTQFGAFIPEIEDLRGVTFYVTDSSTAEIKINGILVPENEIQRNIADSTGQQSIGFKWYTPDYTDYSLWSIKEVRQGYCNLRIIPSVNSVAVSGTTQLTALNAERDIVTATWASSNTAVATVDVNGLLTGVSFGVAKISATFGESRDEVWIIVPSKTYDGIMYVVDDEGEKPIPFYERQFSTDPQLCFKTIDGIMCFDLVETTDARASNLRIKTHNGIKCVAGY